jgi:5'-3' exonuclease
MILIDYSQVSLANILSFKKELMSGDAKATTDLIRHATLATIKSYKKKYGKDYGDIVVCCDGRNYWRRQYFEYYKSGRKKAREASDLDWHMIFDTLGVIRDEMKEHFPYKILHIDQCEADDIIAVLAKQTQEFGFNENVMIVSSDKDFKQLHKYTNVKQYSPLLRKMITAKQSDLHTNLVEHIVKGDSGDGIPNILSKDNCFAVGGNYWRRQYFEYYKSGRKKAREASDLDWHMIFDTLGVIRDEMKEHFPYKILHIDQCEADDIIAVLAKQTQEFGFNENVMIVSSDKDFKQLHKYTNVKQYSPLLRKMITAKQSDLHTNLVEHIVKGDSGDGIPNILSKDNCFAVGDRQTPVSAKRLAEFFEKGYDACRNDEEKRNWKRNEILVQFESIPDAIQKTILDEYLSSKPKGDKMSIMNYLIANRCRLLLDEIEEF